MNRIFAALLAVLLVAGSAYAVEMETTGSFYARGSYINNNSGLSNNDTASFAYYDSELDMTVTLKISDQTKIITNFEIRDQEWLTSRQDDRNIDTGSYALADDGSLVYTAPNENNEFRDNIDFQRVFSSHTFSTGTILDLGLMTGSVWAFSFADNADGYWRVKVLQPMDFGLIGAVIQKEFENGYIDPENKDAEKGDGDTYYLFGVFPVGTHSIQPLLIYSNRSDVYPYGDEEDGLKVMAFDLGIGGVFGPVGYESEFVYSNYNQDWTGGEDYSLFGAYVNVWTTMGATKVGGQIAYGSYDKDGGDGFGFGEDYTPTMFGADWTGVGTTNASEYSAVTLLNLYAEFALSEALTLGGSATYWMSNEEDTVWEDANGYEIDLTGDYKITENVTYSALAAYGQWTQDEDFGGVDDADAFYRLYHKFTINF